ncbi:MAG: hypothetical protein ACXWU4_00955, partial [Allosphingosinicella sp.]
ATGAFDLLQINGVHPARDLIRRRDEQLRKGFVRLPTIAVSESVGFDAETVKQDLRLREGLPRSQNGNISATIENGLLNIGR